MAVCIRCLRDEWRCRGACRFLVFLRYGSRWEACLVGDVNKTSGQALLRRGFVLEYVTLGWKVVGIVVLAVASRSVTLAGFRWGSCGLR
ncbi:hypothetical protein AMK22_11900 [Streptomyces sp. CB01580]|nr:hypothetical protein AMK22_11900 [Streptomyces sp. CB01580]